MCALVAPIPQKLISRQKLKETDRNGPIGTDMDRNILKRTEVDRNGQKKTETN